MTKNKKAFLPVLAVILAFAGSYLSMLLLDFIPVIDSRFNNNIIHPVLIWISTYGVIFIFGLFYYGKDKRLMRFPLAYAFGNAVTMALTTLGNLVAELINFLLAPDFFVSQTAFYVAAFWIGLAVTLVTLLKSLKHEELFCKSVAEAEGEIPSASVRNKLIYGDNAYKVITVLILGLSLLIVRLGVRFGYYAAVKAPSEDEVLIWTYVVDFSVYIAEFIFCYFVSYGFCESKKGAFYFLELVFFAEYMSSFFDGFLRYTIFSLAEVFNMSENFATGILFYSPLAIADTIAIIVSVFIVKWLLSKKGEKSNGLS